MLRIKSSFPTSVVIDDEVITFTIKRFNSEESTHFGVTFDKLGTAAITEDEAMQFMLECFEKYITLDPGQIETEEGQAVTNSLEFAQLMAHRPGVISEIVMRIMVENRFNKRQKAGFYESERRKHEIRQVESTPSLAQSPNASVN